MQRVAEELAGEVDFYYVDADDAPGIAQRYSVQGLPTLIRFEAGRIVDTQIGFVPEERVRTFAVGAGSAH